MSTQLKISITNMKTSKILLCCAVAVFFWRFPWLKTVKCCFFFSESNKICEGVETYKPQFEWPTLLNLSNIEISKHSNKLQQFCLYWETKLASRKSGRGTEKETRLLRTTHTKLNWKKKLNFISVRCFLSKKRSSYKALFHLGRFMQFHILIWTMGCVSASTLCCFLHINKKLCNHLVFPLANYIDMRWHNRIKNKAIRRKQPGVRV